MQFCHEFGSFLPMVQPLNTRNVKSSENINSTYMTYVKINSKPATKSFNNLMDDLFAGMPSIIRDDLVSPPLNLQVPVNIKEREKDFVLDIVAPGFEKNDFRIQLEKNELTVS